MLWTIIVVLAGMWLLGIVSSYTMGGLIHVLLVAAVIMLLLDLLRGRKAFSWVGRPHPVSTFFF